jgi:predicted transcriptional regulator
VISKKEYTKSYFQNMVTNYFGNSYRSLASFFTKEENLSLEELEAIRKMINEQIEKQTSGRNESLG